MLDASVNMGSRVLETQLDSLLFALHQQVHIPKIHTRVNSAVITLSEPGDFVSFSLTDDREVIKRGN